MSRPLVDDADMPCMRVENDVAINVVSGVTGAVRGDQIWRGDTY